MLHHDQGVLLLGHKQNAAGTPPLVTRWSVVNFTWTRYFCSGVSVGRPWKLRYVCSYFFALQTLTLTQSLQHVASNTEPPPLLLFLAHRRNCCCWVYTVINTPSFWNPQAWKFHTYLQVYAVTWHTASCKCYNSEQMKGRWLIAIQMISNLVFFLIDFALLTWSWVYQVTGVCWCVLVFISVCAGLCYFKDIFNCSVLYSIIFSYSLFTAWS